MQLIIVLMSFYTNNEIKTSVFFGDKKNHPSTFTQCEQTKFSFVGIYLATGAFFLFSFRVCVCNNWFFEWTICIYSLHKTIIFLYLFYFFISKWSVAHFFSIYLIPMTVVVVVAVVIIVIVVPFTELSFIYYKIKI